MSRAEINEDPTAGDFFNVDALHNSSDGLVREAIQNSLDAKHQDSTDPVIVRISFIEHPNSPHTTSNAHQFFDGIWNHIDSCSITENPPGKNDPVYWLAIEDFGTRGLTGDPEADEDPAQGQKNDFYYFWRNIGRGKKEGTERGRWGLGKTMFPATSRIHTFFGFTKRADDGRKLLMGQSVLKIHKISNKKYYPYAYFGNAANDGFVSPIDDAKTIQEFSSVFGLSRKDEPGLSVVVPYYSKDTLTIKDMRSSVLKHYFFPILSGELIVEIINKGDKTTFTKDSIRDIARQVLTERDQDFYGMLELAEKFLTLKESDSILAKEPVPHRSPQWDENTFSAEKLDGLAESFDSNSMISMKIPVYIIPKGDEAKLSYFHLVLQRDPNLNRPLDIYIRQGITVSGIFSLREAGVRALLIASEKYIAAFLGDSENPAHTEWQARSRKFQGKYGAGPSTLDFIKHAPRGMMRLLNKRSEMVDDTALRHIFPAPNSAGKNGQEKKYQKHSDPTKTLPEIPKNPVRPKSLSLSRTQDGFTVTLTEQGKSRLPLDFLVRCAYDTGSGNPFKRWASADFDFQKHNEIDLQDGAWIERVENRMRITAEKETFTLRVRGFDPHRDLIVDVRLEAKPNA
ncbi:MAG: hypothetical protein ACHQ1H_03040 [Nitrososphaerales archaeon]